MTSENKHTSNKMSYQAVLLVLCICEVCSSKFKLGHGSSLHPFQSIIPLAYYYVTLLNLRLWQFPNKSQIKGIVFLLQGSKPFQRRFLWVYVKDNKKHLLVTSSFLRLYQLFPKYTQQIPWARQKFSRWSTSYVL